MTDVMQLLCDLVHGTENRGLQDIEGTGDDTVLEPVWQPKLNQILLVAYTYLADVIAGVAKC
jgi:hypothetical protein